MPSTLILASSHIYLLEYIKGDMETLNPEFALYGRKNLSARTDTFFFPLSEVHTRGGDTYDIFFKHNQEAYIPEAAKFLHVCGQETCISYVFWQTLTGHLLIHCITFTRLGRGWI